MTELVEKVARALEDQLCAEDGWMVGTPQLTRMCEDFATAAIEAMRPEIERPSIGEIADRLHTHACVMAMPIMRAEGPEAYMASNWFRLASLLKDCFPELDEAGEHRSKP